VLAWVGTVVAVLVVMLIALSVLRQRAQAMPRVPKTAAGMRKIGDHEYATTHFEMARRFYVRALALDSTDAGARRGLACASAKLGRGDARGCD
jgi:predicted TPR repeat methyltransferase